MEQGANINSQSQQQLDGADLNIDIRELYLTIKRRKEIVIAITAFFAAMMLIFLFLQTPIYKAETTIQINVNGNKVVDIESVVSGISSDDSAIQSEIDVLNSRYLASRVIDKLKLVRDREFNPEYGKNKSSGFFGLFSSEDQLSEEEKADKKRIEHTMVVNKFLDSMKASRKPRSYTITIEFESESAKKASLIANTIADEYLVSQLAVKFDATERANQWLNKKLDILQKQLRQSELAVEAFRQQNDLIETSGITINDQQLSGLNTQLIISSTTLAQAQARLESAEESIDSTPEVLNSMLIQNLRQQEAEVLRKKSDLASRYGKKHPKMINVNAELRDLRIKIGVEIDKIILGLKKEVEIARIGKNSIEKTLRSLQGKSGTSSKARVQLDELTRQRDTSRTLYESFLLRSKETSQNKDIEQIDARIISVAEVPLRPHYPRKTLMMLIALIVGGGFGVVVVFLIEHLDNAFKDIRQVEQFTNTPSIGVIPQLEGIKDIVKYIHDKPSSVFVESLRSVLTSIHFSNPDNIPKSVLVTSSVPNEGKTTFSIALAAMLTRSGQKVLLIDCDLKKPSVAKEFGIEKVKFGLADYLANEATREQIINTHKDSKIDFISSKSNISNSQDLLSSNKMKDFIKEMSAKYDLVILDSPPLMAVSDAIVASKLVDTVAFIVRWNKTPRPVVNSALKKLKYQDIKLAGIVLNCANLEKLSKYSYGEHGYYYSNYKEYYSE